MTDFQFVPREDAPTKRHMASARRWVDAFLAAIANPDRAVVIDGLTAAVANSCQSSSRNRTCRAFGKVSVAARKQADGTYTVYITAVES